MSVYQGTDGRWRFRVTGYWMDGTSECISGTAPKNKNSEKAAERVERERLVWMSTQPPPADGAQEEPRNTPLASASGASGEPVASPPKVIPTLNEFRDTFLSVAKLDNEPCSTGNKESMLRVHILPRLGDKRLCDVNLAEVQDFAVTLSQATHFEYKRTPRASHPNTVNNVLGCLQHVLRLAHDRGLRGIVPEFPKLKAPPAKFDFLDYEEADRLIAASEGEWRTMIIVALRTGMRRGELLGLGKDAVDLRTPCVHVRRKYYKGRFGLPKSGRPREIPLSGQAAEALAAHTHERSADLVFCDAEGRPFTASVMRNKLRAICKAAGLRKIGWHVLRHTFASHLLMRGATLKAVQELMGHSSIKVTERYMHLAAGVKSENVQRLDGPPPGAVNGQAAVAETEKLKRPAARGVSGKELAKKPRATAGRQQGLLSLVP